MRKFLALALACTFALSSAVVVTAEVDLSELPDPVAVYTFTDSEYEVVANGSGTVEVVKDYNEETKMGKGNVLHVPASGSTEEVNEETGETVTVYSDTEISLPNPFAGMDLSEGTQTADVRGDDYEADDIGMPIWYDGVVINYWIKTVDDTNSVVINFRNLDRLQFHKDDWRMHLLAVEAKAAYDAAMIDGDASDIDSRFALGTTDKYFDDEGKEYLVYNGGGEYMQYNPDYVAGYKLGTGSITVYKEGTDPEVEESWVVIGAIGENKFEGYYEPEYAKNEKSMVRQAYCDGHLQFSLDGSISFMEDDGASTELNPNVQNPKGEFNVRNGLQMHGSTTLTDTLSGENADSENWHMVTIVIQNDWIDYYLDGELYEDLADEFSYFATPLSSNAGGKSFNAGFGLRAPFQRGPSARATYLSGNRAGLLLTEWLSNDMTTVSIGGTNARALEETYGDHPERVAEFWIDDVAFYDTLLDEDQIWTLYEAGLENIAEGGIDKTDCLIGDVDKDGDIDAADALAVLKHAAKVEILEDTAPAMTDSDDLADAADALNILKVAAKILKAEDLPIQK